MHSFPKIYDPLKDANVAYKIVCKEPDNMEIINAAYIHFSHLVVNYGVVQFIPPLLGQIRKRKVIENDVCDNEAFAWLLFCSGAANLGYVSVLSKNLRTIDHFFQIMLCFWWFLCSEKSNISSMHQVQYVCLALTCLNRAYTRFSDRHDVCFDKIVQDNVHFYEFLSTKIMYNACSYQKSWV